MSAETPIGLAALESKLRRELSLLNLPARSWLTPRPGVLDVAIVGGGLSGLCAAAALTFLGVDNIVALDRAPVDREGPWVTYARMRTLRTEKNVSGPAMGIPALTPRAWFEAQYGAEAWRSLERIPRTMWMDYLIWYRRVLALPVRNNVEVTSIAPRPDGLVGLTVAGNRQAAAGAACRAGNRSRRDGRAIHAGRRAWHRPALLGAFSRRDRHGGACGQAGRRRRRGRLGNGQCGGGAGGGSGIGRHPDPQSKTCRSSTSSAASAVAARRMGSRRCRRKPNGTCSDGTGGAAPCPAAQRASRLAPRQCALSSGEPDPVACRA